ncbi:hypothetical protein DERF_006386 [Dermatophagoides farinae]|uniref:Uncharacterized protein n=1 Tax=Dermatophagoides farinae TaxID=6954 RepID=A0A922IBI1_DERFA|nr:hypothetical protein DERF_006386 [Dermatophagoides farinae]
MINQTNTSRTASLVNNQQQHSQVSKPLLLIMEQNQMIYLFRYLLSLAHFWPILMIGYFSFGYFLPWLFSGLAIFSLGYFLLRLFPYLAIFCLGYFLFGYSISQPFK